MQCFLMKKGTTNILHAVTEPWDPHIDPLARSKREADLLQDDKRFYGLRFKIFICNTN